MAALIKNSDTENYLRKLLKKEGYTLSNTKTHGETGTDIIAIKNKKELYIEVIGYKKSGPSRAKDFMKYSFVLFQG